MKARILRLVLLLTPTLLLAGWAASLAYQLHKEPSMRVAISGYDPRDLLRGHYISFRLELTYPNGKAPDCACLQPNPAAPLRPLAAPARCGAPRPSNCPHFITNPQQPFRYYASQEQAKDLERDLRAVPGAASVTVHFRGDGAVSFSDVATPP